jgi:hypothetical protein
MPVAQKIITTLQERRQIEAGLRAMLTASSELEYRQQAQRVSALGSQVIPAIVGNLDRANAQMLTAMGVVARFLDHEEISQALRQAALHPQRTDQGRVGAMMILERFLGEPPNEDLLASVADPKEVAAGSLEVVLAQAEHNPAILIEYIHGLDRQEPDVVLAAARTLRDLQDQRAVEPLRMMAMDVRSEIAAMAIQILGEFRFPEAARALQTLVPTTGPELRPLAERAVRKLRFTGVQVHALPGPDPLWRALISPVDGLGQQHLWFIQPDRTEQARFLTVLLNDRAGVVEAVGHTRVLPPMLPPRRPTGHIHDVGRGVLAGALPDGSGAMLMLETLFDLGRRLVREALDRNRETQIPVAPVLRYLSPWLWGVGGADSLPPRVLPGLTGQDYSLAEEADRLLQHPAFALWAVQAEAIVQAEAASLGPAQDLELQAERLARELFHEPEVRRIFSQRLAAVSEWLLLAGEREQSHLAWVAAQAMRERAPQDQPFLRAWIRCGLRQAGAGIPRQSEPTPGSEENL